MPLFQFFQGFLIHLFVADFHAAKRAVNEFDGIPHILSWAVMDTAIFFISAIVSIKHKLCERLAALNWHWVTPMCVIGQTTTRLGSLVLLEIEVALIFLGNYILPEDRTEV